MSLSRVFSLLLRVTAFLLVAFCFFVGRPPATAIQVPPSTIDAVQNEKLAVIAEKVESHERIDDTRVNLIAQTVSDMKAEIREQRGEMRGIFGAFAILQLLAILVQTFFKREKK